MLNCLFDEWPQFQQEFPGNFEMQAVYLVTPLDLEVLYIPVGQSQLFSIFDIEPNGVSILKKCLSC